MRYFGKNLGKPSRAVIKVQLILAVVMMVALAGISIPAMAMEHAEVVNTGTPLGDGACNPSIKVKKSVYNGTRWLKTIDATLGDTVQFRGYIKNDGPCCNLTDIVITDILPDGLVYAGSATLKVSNTWMDIDPPSSLSVNPITNETTVEWIINDFLLVDTELAPGEVITIKYSANVTGCCPVLLNTATVNATCVEAEETVGDSDTATVNVNMPCTLPAPTLPTGSQLWYLDSETIIPAPDYQMEKAGGPGDDGQLGSVVVLNGTSEIWIADQAALFDVTFPSGSWVVELVTDGNWGDNGNKCNVTIGAWNGTTFSPFTTTNTVSVTGSSAKYLLLETALQAGSTTVDKDDWLALKIENKDGSDYTVYTNDCNGKSYLISPTTDPGYPVPELVSGILFGLGILGLGAYYIRSRRHKSLA